MIRYNDFSPSTYAQWCKRSDGVKDLMERLLNDLVINDTRWLDHNNKFKQKTNLQNDSRPYLNGPTNNGPIYNSLTYNDNGQAKFFNAWNPSRFLNQSAINQLQNSANKKVKKSSLSLFAFIINLANKNNCGAQGAWGWPLFLQCALSLQRLLPLSGWTLSLQNLLPLLQN